MCNRVSMKAPGVLAECFTRLQSMAGVSELENRQGLQPSWVRIPPPPLISLSLVVAPNTSGPFNSRLKRSKPARRRGLPSRRGRYALPVLRLRKLERNQVLRELWCLADGALSKLRVR